jgi:hypothetical protein
MRDWTEVAGGRKIQEVGGKSLEGVKKRMEEFGAPF